MSHDIAPTRMEPTRIKEMSDTLADLSSELVAQAGQLAGRLHPRTMADMAGMVRLMNSCYSNQIEGNNTRPPEIERALAGTFDTDPARRALQRENAAHIRLQAQIDAMALAVALPDPSGEDFLKFLHAEFYRDTAPADLWVKDGVRIDPGEWRSHDVEIGLHVAPPAETVPAFMAHFHQRFRLDQMTGRTARILGMATAHHRFAWVHPFQDGNGRVARLMSHAMACHAGIAAGGLWSVSRGLARGLADGVPGRQEYKEMLATADRPRQGDRDGRGDRDCRGNLSLQGLISFATWFLKVCLDQIDFMARLYDIRGLEDRLTRYVASQGMHEGSMPLLRAMLTLGEVQRGAVPMIIGASDSTALRLTRQLVENGIIGSVTPKGALSLRFGSRTHDILFPRLFDVEG